MTKLYPSANYDRWTTVQPAPGVSRDQVVIMAEGPGSTGRFAEDMIRWKDVQIFKDASPGWSTLFYLESDHSVWFDGAELFDKNGQFNGGDVVGGNKPNFVYATDAIIRDVQNMTSICGFCRNVLAKNIGSDVFRARSNIMSIGMIVDTINKGSTDAHPDFFQFHAPNATIENIVIYNTKVINMGAQGIFGGGGGGVLRDVAFVNLVMQRTSSVGYLSQLSGSWEHVLFWNFTVSEGPFFLRETAGLKDFFIQNSIWHMLHAGSATSLPDFVIDTNLTRTLNWNQPEPMGTHTLEGDPLFVDEENRDFRLSANSPAREAGIPLPGVPADIDNKLYDISKPNLGAYAE